MKLDKCLLVPVLLILSLQLQAQQVHQFTEGLVAENSHHYGREALYTDQLAYELNKGALKTPAEGQQVFSPADHEAVSWKSIKVNEEQKFKERSLANGYIYLTYEAAQDAIALLHVSGHSMLYFNGEPRSGDIYGDNWLYLPVQLKKGINELYVRGSRFSAWQGIEAALILSGEGVKLNTEDPTLPHIVVGENKEALWGAMVVINASQLPAKNLQIRHRLEGKELVTSLPEVPPMTIRKVGFRIDAGNVQKKGHYTGKVSLIQKGKVLDEKEIKLDAVEALEHYSNTFISDIDGSVQYYGVAPRQKQSGGPGALFLSVHGAGVEAIGQARAYQPKDWGVLVAPTNRRPRGFNWEDWGRLDALEVLEIASEKFKPDPQQIYLTGHSMGGHGTWYLGATFPGKWAAIAPCAGYPSLAAYGSADGKIPEKGKSHIEDILLQASNPSNVFELAPNYSAGGIYIHHGDSDKVVSVEYARQMRELLSSYHKDFSYYEYPGGSHWFGNESVDWPPIFDYFKWHSIQADSAVNNINFTTANPAVSASYHWVSVQQQQTPLKYSRVQLVRNKKKKTISGKTENVSVLGIELDDFTAGDTLQLLLDEQEAIRYVLNGAERVLYLQKDLQWRIGQKPSPALKGTQRNGTFKEPFNHRMLFVYSTGGSREENDWSYHKARYDAEVWYYRGNGAVDIVADKDFRPADYPDRGVVLYGNASTNKAWNKLLRDCPIQVQRGAVQVGGKKYSGNNLGAYFMWPRKDSPIASVAVVSGTGLEGMKAADANQYFSGGSGFPDYMIFSSKMLEKGHSEVKVAGFYGNDWSLEKGESVVQ
ncbi:alpha/beta hydrolase-fold protein [Cesiribacter sp. SM1]|uniref:carboxylesterase family protein n=1 Tax=Cesiribacter sp. SM1 TaxID=2861196 RepID=UPI001CD2148B|nr:alpha/beta hydrolase-fold protein [Cesiribacter sp. SM1]